MILEAMQQALLLILCLLISKAIADISHANNEFALNLYDSLASNKEAKRDNLIFSPISISIGLGMVRSGARMNTLSQINKVLAVDDIDKGDISLLYRSIIAELNRADKNFTLEMANKIFVDTECPLVPLFVSELKENFYATSEELDFKKVPEQCRIHINKWVEDNTNGRIRSFIPPHGIQPHTVIVLVNAMHFKAAWKYAFDKNATETSPFHMLDGRTALVDMMYVHGLFNFKEDAALNCKILELPFDGEETSMYILLPNQADGILSLYEDRNTTDRSLKQILSGLQPSKTRVWLPKFKLDQSFSLRTTLSGMGMVDLFTAAAVLSGMSKEGMILLSKVLHQANVEVDEDGSVASAATSVGLELSIDDSEQFIADHPFMFIIWEKTIDSALFIGRLARHPNETQSLMSFTDDMEPMNSAERLSIALVGQWSVILQVYLPVFAAISIVLQWI